MAAAQLPVRLRADAGSFLPPFASRFAAVAAVVVSAATLEFSTACASVGPLTDSNSIATATCRQVQPPAAPPPRWWSSAASQSNPKLLRWCATVGPVVVQPTTSSPVNRPIDRLAVVSWNLHVGAGDIDRLVARLRAGEFTHGEPVDDFVLLLQEAYRRTEAIPVRVARGFPVPDRIAAHRNRGPDIDHFWRDEGLAVIYAPSMRNGIVDLDREDRGNAIVSTIDLDRPLLIELPLERQRRVVVSATAAGITTTGEPWRLRMVDVHLDTAIALTRGGPFAARRRQAEMLIAALRDTADSDPTRDTTIVAGDFNTWGGNEPALDALAAAFPTTRDNGREPTWKGALALSARLDHVFAAGSAHVEVGRLPDRFGSDHYPLLAVITF